jgi:riboflavin transporter FmnP
VLGLVTILTDVMLIVLPMPTLFRVKRSIKQYVTFLLTDSCAMACSLIELGLELKLPHFQKAPTHRTLLNRFHPRRHDHRPP